jgi:hypothetical protein
MATVGTSTSSEASGNPGERHAHVAADGTALAVYHDGSDLVLRTASSPYSSWSSTTTVDAGADAAGADLLASGDDAHVVYKTSNQFFHRLLTKSGSTWSVGTEHTITTNHSEIGTTAKVLADSAGRLWAFTSGYTGSDYALRIYQSNDAGATWTFSADLTDLDVDGNGTFTAGVSGTRLLAVAVSGSGEFKWRYRTTGDGLTTWAAVATQSGTSSYRNSEKIAAATDADGDICVVTAGANTQPTMYRYVPGTNTWSGGSAVGASSNDRHPALCTIGTDTYVVWSKQAGASNYALVYKVWNGTTLGTEQTLQASGANRLRASAGGSAALLGVLNTLGTGSPYTVEFFSATLAGGGAQDTPELRGRPFGLRGHTQQHQLLAQ